MGQVIGSCGEGLVHPRAPTSKSVGLERRMRRMHTTERLAVRAAQKRSREARSKRQQFEAIGGVATGVMRCKVQPGVRASAVVLPRGTSFDTEFELTGAKVGSGMSGSVQLARRRGLHRSAAEEHACDFVAVKKLHKRGLSRSDLARVAFEAETHLKMDHPNIVRLLRISEDRQNLYLVTEYCSGGSLADRLEAVGCFSEQEAADVVYQVLCAINYCHKHPLGKVCHRDLKHANVVYASKKQGAAVKLLDFGLSDILSARRPRLQCCAGTVGYMAPEVISKQQYTESCDLWSLGVIAYTLLCGGQPFDCSTKSTWKRAVLSGTPRQMTGQVWNTVSDLSKEFVQRLLSLDPEQRPTAEEALRLPWMGEAARGGEVQAPARSLLATLWRHAQASAVRRAVAAFVVYSNGVPSSRELELLEAQFRLLDTDSDGTISAAEFEQALQAAFQVPQAEAHTLFGQLDVDGDAKIQWSECLAAVVGEQLLHAPETVNEAFSRFDENKDGRIELSELEHAFGKECCGLLTKDIFDQCDTNGDKTIDIAEFAAALLPQYPEPVPVERSKTACSGSTREPDLDFGEEPSCRSLDLSGDDEVQNADLPTLDVCSRVIIECRPLVCSFYSTLEPGGDASVLASAKQWRSEPNLGAAALVACNYDAASVYPRRWHFSGRRRGWAPRKVYRQLS